MRKRQKLVLLLYAFVVFFTSFIYVPCDRYYQGGIKTYAGNYLRSTPLWSIPKPWGYIAINADLILAQVIAFTAIAAYLFLLLRRE